MTPPKIIVFDLGKVLLDFDYRIAARRIAAKSTDRGDIYQLFTIHSELLLRYETGLVSSAEFFQGICRATGFSGSLEEFAGFFADIFWEIPTIIELHATVRRQCIPTYIFSNTNDLAVLHIRRNVGVVVDLVAGDVDHCGGAGSGGRGEGSRGIPGAVGRSDPGGS